MRHTALALVATLALSAGCTTAPMAPRLIPIQSDGLGVGMDIGAAADRPAVVEIVQRHPVLSALATAGAGFAGYWLYQQMRDDGDGSGGGSTPAPAPVSIGDGNAIIVGDTGGDVRVNIGNTGD